jgi:adenylyltransferase/sulfurtransferase
MNETLRSDNVLDLVADSQIIVDATDTIETRKALNRASVGSGIPFIYGGVNQFDGTVSTFIPGQTPCFECLFHQGIDKTEPIGVIGPAPAIVGAIQSLEAIKIILGIKGLITNQLLCMNGLDMTFKKIRIEKNPDCPVCGSNSGKQ